MLTIYGAELSAPVNKVRYMANALGLEYELRTVNMAKGEHKSEAYLTLHPAGKVPVINDNGFILFESNAIIKYLNEKNGGSYYPRGIQDRAIVDQWTDFASMHVGTAMGRVFFNKVLAPAFNRPLDEQSMKDGRNFLDHFLPVVDVQLGKKPFLAGDAMTVADFTLLAVLDPAEVSEVDLSPFTNLSKWRADLKAQEFYQKCFHDYSEVITALVK